MSHGPFRFVHASDFHLELPPFGVTEVPDHLRELFLESPYMAAERVFETALAEEVELLVLSGDILNSQYTGPRGPLFLAEQFARLAERDIAVYWAGGRIDPPDAWPAAVTLPENVHVFPRGRLDEQVHERDGAPLLRIMGASLDRRRRVRASEFEADPSGLFSVGVIHGAAKAAPLEAQRIDYWALGGRHDRASLFSSPQVAHYAGSPQGRQPEEQGSHGCTVVHVDERRRARTTLAPTDLLRWVSQRIVVDDATTRDDLEMSLRERMQTLLETTPSVDLLVSWKITGTGALLARLRRSGLGGELLDWLRTEYGYGPPTAWSVALDIEPSASLPPQWYEQDSIRGDFLRVVRQRQAASSEPLVLNSYVTAEGQAADALRAMVALPDETTQQRVLSAAALLGVDLLSGEEASR